MLSVYAIGIQLERLFGTIKLATIMFYILAISGVLYVLICYSLSFLLDKSWVRYRSIGFSGMFFCELIHAQDESNPLPIVREIVA